MAKGDYYVIVAKILVYLYKKYKQMDVDDSYLQPMTKDFPIKDRQFIETIEMLIDQGYVRGNITRAWGGDIALIDYQSLKITPAGIYYLQDNSKIRKVCEFLKEEKDIFSLFI